MHACMSQSSSGAGGRHGDGGLTEGGGGRGRGRGEKLASAGAGCRGMQKQKLLLLARLAASGLHADRAADLHA